MRTLHTQRLTIRRMTSADAAFVVELLNTPGWLRFIGDRGVRSLADAVRYIETGPMAMATTLGLGFSVVELKQTGEPLGICGLAQRDYLDHRDIGFAFLPQHGGQGYAYESARAVLDHAQGELGLPRVLATTRIDNLASQRLLEKLGLRFERLLSLRDPERELRVYGIGTQP